MSRQQHIEAIVHHLFELCKDDDRNESIERLQVAIEAAKSLFQLSSSSSQLPASNSSSLPRLSEANVGVKGVKR